MQCSKELLLNMYKSMATIRQFEERIVDLYARGLVPGLAHLYIGEEAVAVGVCSALNDDDYITSTHRGHGHVIAKGARLTEMMAELFGKKTGYCKGKGGSMHIADMEIGILGANGIAGGGLPIATGAGWSAKWRGTSQVSVAFFGDNSSNNGTFHESLNLAAVKKLPVIFICENNLYGISNPQANQMLTRDISVRAASYEMPGQTVDGNDVLAVYEAMSTAVNRARAQQGPSLIECKTYRWRGHHEGDPNQGERYRSREEIAEWRKKDPIERFTKHLLQEQLATQDELDAVDAAVKTRIDSCVEFAQSSDFPALEELYEDVYVNEA